MAITEHKYYIALCDVCGQPLRKCLGSGSSMLDGYENYYPIGMKSKQSLYAMLKDSKWAVNDGKFKCPDCIKNKPGESSYTIGGKVEHDSPVIVE